MSSLGSWAIALVVLVGPAMLGFVIGARRGPRLAAPFAISIIALFALAWCLFTWLSPDGQCRYSHCVDEDSIASYIAVVAVVWWSYATVLAYGTHLLGQDRRVLSRLMRSSASRRGLAPTERLLLGVLLLAVFAIAAVAWFVVQNAEPTVVAISSGRSLAIVFAMFVAFPVFAIAAAFSRLGLTWWLLATIAAAIGVGFVWSLWTTADCLDCHTDGATMRDVRSNVVPFQLGGVAMLSCAAAAGGLVGTALRRPAKQEPFFYVP